MKSRLVGSTPSPVNLRQEGEYIYAKSGPCEFSVSNGWWYPVNGGAGACYESTGWIYTSNGKSAFYFRLIIRRLVELGLEAKSRTGPIAAGRPQKKNAHSA